MSAIHIRNPSLELNWLPNSVRKGITTPRLVLLEDEERWGGAYWRSTPRRCVVDMFDLDLSEGPVIAICARRNSACLAHEYRHHWQIENGFQFGASVWTMEGRTYESSIVHYFKSFWWEMDALSFELKHAPNDLNLQWREWIVHS